jgi:uncharacterized protein YcbK (DUF882 family)
MFSTRTMTAADWAASKHFKASEFRNPDKMGAEFIQWLNAVREQAGVPMRITSDYRSPDRNLAVGGAQASSHCDTPCNAVDIGQRIAPDDPNGNLARFKIVQAALALGCTRIGIYANGSVHLDRTEQVRPADRLWFVVNNPAR